ncbi:MAG: hypothetical protein RMJ53_07900 [Chitinophagales bacterium]|nr:hypothetical protein [Chitinophagales bacterium]MDW8274135.1 hypothetical protein [Chitinophagales bacterium]
MSGKRKSNIPLTENGVITEEAMLAYLRGELSSENVVKFEKLLAEDPFAQEALEGYRQKEVQHSLKENINDLKQRVIVRSGAKKKIASFSVLYIFRYAVAAVIAGIFIALTFFITRYFDKKSDLALEREQSSVTVTPNENGQNILNADSTTLQNGKEIEALAEKSSLADSTNITINSNIPQGLQEPAYPNAPSAETRAKTETNFEISPAAKVSTTPTGNKDALSGEIKNATPAQSIKEEPKALSKNEYAITDQKYAITDPKNLSVQSTTISDKDVSKTSDKFEDGEEVLPLNMESAMENFKKKNYKAAAKQFNKIAEREPENLDAIYYGGISLYINGDNNKALKNFEKLIEKGKKHTDGSKWYKSQILLRKGKKDEALLLLFELSSSTGIFQERAIEKINELQR